MPGFPSTSLETVPGGPQCTNVQESLRVVPVLVCQETSVAVAAMQLLAQVGNSRREAFYWLSADLVQSAIAICLFPGLAC